MTDPVNLGKVRKARAKAAREQTAQANRVKFGWTKAEKKLEAAQKEKAARSIDSHRRDDEPPPER